VSRARVRGAFSSRSVNTDTGHVSLGQRQGRFHHTSCTGSPKHGTHLTQQTDATSGLVTACQVGWSGRQKDNGRVLLQRLNAVQGAGLGLVGLAGSDDLAVARVESEPELAGLVFVQLELTRHDDSPHADVGPGNVEDPGPGRRSARRKNP